jgi:ATP-dependent protease ClpP protease subunit
MTHKTPVPIGRFFGRSGNKTPVFQALAPDPKGGGSEVTMRLYDAIDSWGDIFGVSAKEFADSLDAIGESVSTINLRINSPGGDVWEALAIYNSLRNHPAKVVAYVDGIAASAASIVAMAADELVMMPHSELMIHDAWGVAVGPAEEMAKMATELDRESNNLAGIYADKAGGTVADWRAVMQGETWYFDQEAVDAGLANRVDTGEPVEPVDQAKARFNRSVFNYAGRDKAPAPKPPAASADGFNKSTQEGRPAVAFSDEQVTSMRQQLGLPEDADEATILAALDEALAERADETPVAASTIPAGHVVIPEARLRDLEIGASAGTRAAETLHNQERSAFLESVKAKYAPTNRAAWEAEYDRDPEGTRKHFESAPVIVNLVEGGHGQETELSSDDALYASLYGQEA